MFPRDCDRMNWDLLMVSCAAVSVTADKVETWIGNLGILPLQNPLFLEGNQSLCRAQACSGTGAAGDCRGLSATPRSQARAGTWAPIIVISCSQSN